MRHKKQRPPTRKQSQKLHARHRALERLGFPFTRDDQGEVRRQIRNGTAVLVQRSRTRRVYDVVIRGMPLRIVYDSAHGCVVTVYQPEGTKRVE